MTKPFLMLSLTASLLPAIAHADPAPAPSFAQLESSYAASGAVAAAIAALAPSLAPATPLAAAKARLTSAGAECRSDRHRDGRVTCLYHQYDLGDGAADDIRWTITLHANGESLQDFTVRRYVDRHGSS